MGFPVLRLVPFAYMPSPLPRQDRWNSISLVPFHRLRPSPENRRVGSCISRFEACSAFTHVMACTLAKSPSRPSTPKAPAALSPPPLLRLLPGGANQFPGGSVSRCGPTPFHGARVSVTCSGWVPPTSQLTENPVFRALRF